MPASESWRIALKGAAFGYGGTPIVSGVDLVVGPGDFLGVLGPNGAGKSTLFRGLLGMLPVLAGTYEREGVRPGYVPQRETLDSVFPLTVEELVLLGAGGRLDRLGRVRREDRELAHHWLERVELAQRAKSTFRSLSGGQRQRALLARALLMRPNLLLLDEPTSGVDRPTQALILDLLCALNREQALAILLVSHELASTQRVVKRVVWVDGGRATPLSEDELHAERIEELFAATVGARPPGNA